MLARLIAYIRGITRRRRIDAEVDDELQFHLASEIDAHIARGASPAEARRLALRDLGGMAQTREAVREVRTLWLDVLSSDLRDACRGLGRNRTFTITVTLVLALGIGATTTVYAIARGIALRPLPFEDSERLMFIGELSPTGRREAVAPANFLDLAAQSRTFERLAMYRGTRFILTGRPEPESVNGSNVSSSFFSALRIQPAHGRLFVRQDDHTGAPREAILSDRGWTRYFGRDSAIVGRGITLDSIDHVVVGILPPDVSLFDTDIFVGGFDSNVLNSRGARNTGALGRLAAGVSTNQALAELEVIGQQLATAYPATNAKWTFRATSLQDAWLGAYRPVSVLLIGAVAIVMLIACANVASLLFERGLARSREVTIRLALGASRRRILHQMLTESVLLAVVGGATGVVAGWWSLGFVVAQIPSNTLTQIPGGTSAIRFDVHSLGVALAISFVTAVLFGLAPALRLARAHAQTVLREAARNVAGDRQRDRWRRVLVVAQVALSAVLLSAAALMIQSFARLAAVDRGYDPGTALSFGLFLPQIRYAQPTSRDAFFTTVIEKLRALPGVEQVGGTTLLSSRGRPFDLEGKPVFSRDAAPMAVYRVATPSYMDALGIPLVSGRQFSEADRAGVPDVAIVNQTFARTAWPQQDPIGRRVRLLGPPGDVWLTVIGVAGDIKESLDPRLPLALEARPTIYRPALQESVASMTLIVRTEQNPAVLSAAARRVVASLDPMLPVMALQPVRQGIAASIQTPRFNTVLFTSFATLALVLTAVGLYGVIAYEVSQRRKEIGIRMALGAPARQVSRAVLRDGLALTFMGLTLGIAGTLGAMRLIAQYLYGVQATDPGTFIIVASALLLVATTASYVPAQRAAGVDPLVALRYE